MSGARALASARRRRAEPQNVMPQNSQNKIINDINDASDIKNGNDVPRNKISPAMMLLSHNKIIENLQMVIEDLNNRMDEQEKKTEERIKDAINSSKCDSSDIEFYKTKMSTIDNGIEEIKKHTLKVQTFSMETNLQLVELKKRLNKYEKNEVDKQDKQREEIIEHINTVSTILTKINYEVEQSKQVQSIQNNTLVDILEGINNKIVSETVDMSENEEHSEELEKRCGVDEDEEVGGEVDEEVGGEVDEEVGVDEDEEVGGEVDEEVGVDEDEEVGVDEDEEVGGEVDEEVGGEVDEEVGGEVDEEVGGEVDEEGLNTNKALDGINEEEELEENLENDEGEESTKLNF